MNDKVHYVTDTFLKEKTKNKDHFDERFAWINVFCIIIKELSLFKGRTGLISPAILLIGSLRSDGGDGYKNVT